MKPFNLEAALAGAPCVTGDGHEAYVIGRDDDLPMPLVVKIKTPGTDRWVLTSRRDDGVLSSYRETDNLFMAPVKRTVWINVYPQRCRANIYFTEGQADAAAGANRAGGRAWPLEIEE